MQTQDIFKAFGANWTWASVDKAGAAWVHTYKPNAGSQAKHQQILNARANAFDTMQPQEERTSWARTDFSNGPSYSTDEFGMGIPSLPGAPPAPPAQQALTITTEEAENGKLWDFALPAENYVSVNQFGVVWFDLFKDGPMPRRSYVVEVDGVTHSIERTRSATAPTAPTAQPAWPAPPMPEFNVDYPAPGLSVDGLEPDEGKPVNEKPWPSPELQKAYQSGALAPGLSVDEPHGWYDRVEELEKKLNRQRRVLMKAKARARALLSIYNPDNSTQLTCVQYTAIFGELPK
jgi:hypothetical protein